MSQAIHPKTAIGHVHLIVNQLESMVDFYTNIIGFEVIKREEKKVFLGIVPKQVLLVLEHQPTYAVKPVRTVGLYHFAILLPTRADLARALMHLAELRTPMQGASDHGFSEALYLADPEGNGIEIYADRPREQWEGRVDEVGTTIALDIEDLLQSAAGNEEWNGLPKGTVIGHIHLHISDLAQARAFYVDQLGFEIMTVYGGQALFVAAGGYHHHIGLNTWAGTATAPAHSTGLYAYGLVFNSEASRAETIKQWAATQVEVVQAGETSFIVDPWGNHIELLVGEKTI